MAPNTPNTPSEGWVAALRRFIEPAPSIARCELCSLELMERHPHLIAIDDRRLLCACDACALLYSGDAQKFRRVPRDSARLDDFQMSDEHWAGLGIPVGIAFFFKSTRDQRVVAIYPGAAGAMESLLDLSTWGVLEDANPVLREIETDVEALLANHLDGARDYYRMPLDRCYALSGLIRSTWSGFTGGSEMREAVAQFFADAVPACDSVRRVAMPDAVEQHA